MHKLLFITFFLVVSIVYAQDYCSPKLCDAGVKHIACGNSGQFASSCPKDKKIVTISKETIGVILMNHNKLRNKIASGQQPGFLPAKRMATMTWNSELAKLAELNVKQCKMEHDKCHATTEYKFAGQNLGERASTGAFEPVDSFAAKVINSWYDEVQGASQSDINKCCNSASGKVIGHFTQVVTQRAIQVGCAIAAYTNGKWKTSLMACNYAFTNLVGSPVYENGKTASGCTKGTNKDFPALCSVDEPIMATA